MNYIDQRIDVVVLDHSSTDKITDIFLANAAPASAYDGFILHAYAIREMATNWANKKGLLIDYKRLFGHGPMPPFYSGKCYFLDRAFAAFVG